MENRPDLSIIAPMYNEEENVADTIAKMRSAMGEFSGSWEFILVNDGSTDGSFERAVELAGQEPNMRVVGYEKNRGRGAALRTGFEAAAGRIVATVDFDLSYSPDHILAMYDILAGSPEVDMVLASCYMPGGAVEGVPPGRLAISRLGNVILRLAFNRRFYTTTCVVRAYRREVLDALELESDGKEIHLEILSKAITLGFDVAEMPAVLRARAKGSSKFSFFRTSVTHLAFAFQQEPMLLVKALIVFSTLGALLGLAHVCNRLFLWHFRSFDYPRPGILVPVVKILLVTGLLYFCIGIYGLVVRQAKKLRDNLVRQESDLRLLKKRLGQKENREDP